MRSGISYQTAVILLLTLFASACSHSVQPPLQPSTASPPSAKQHVQPLEARPTDLEPVKSERHIAATQRALTQLGYPAGKVDGILGAATRRAIAAFQKDHGLSVDGHLTPALASMLSSLVAQLPKTNITLATAGDTIIFDDGSAETVSIDQAISWDENNSHSLVAIRPATAGWPPAARAGLDWATTHALEAAGAPPLQWSSTGVDEHFEIYASATLSPREAALAGNAASSCRHFELRGGGPQKRYPGIACRDAKGSWYLPHSQIRLARPATGLGAARQQPQQN
jgi:peptidoglycan hydrolase-like protein with peptidoglycan-binding domain